MIVAMTKKKLVGKFDKIKGTRITMDTDHNTHNLFLCHLAIDIFLNLPDGLIICANWYEHSSRCFELVDEGVRKPLGCRTDMDSVIWTYMQR